ncbi:hypothetical protein ACWAT4_11885 [Bradyrhizobium manausense]
MISAAQLPFLKCSMPAKQAASESSEAAMRLSLGLLRFRSTTRLIDVAVVEAEEKER